MTNSLDAFEEDSVFDEYFGIHRNFFYNQTDKEDNTGYATVVMQRESF